jgi:tetratricopeptide (TPR) repeat protein
MASLIPGYEYDIFISYRQKDNKHDGWVTEFVNHLKGELESTFKEEISVYFDINPHDGLLETHDVDASLKEKLKCLVFIPIISRTYCDPKSFAWEHEFKAFIERASQDQFGLKVKLPNGNVASRVLPIRIYDLDNADIKLCESVLRGYLRGVEFVYKSAGVNRPVRSKEENPQENLNHTIYRDQINKVANTIREIISGLQRIQTAPAEEVKDEISISADGKPELIKVAAEQPSGENPLEKKHTGKPVLTRKNIWIYSLSSTVIVVLAVLVIFIFSSGSTLPFSRRDWIVITDFDNLTGNPDFDKSLYTAFSISINQSKYINVFPKSRMIETLARMEIKDPTFVDEKTGKEIAIREGIGLYIVPGISEVGNRYAITGKIMETKSGNLLKSEILYTETQDEILSGIDKLARKIRQDLGESRYNIAMMDKPLAEVTTSSLEALKLYSLGHDRQGMADFKGARDYFERALKIDSGFTAARASLGTINIEKFDPVIGRELLSQAVKNVDNLTEKEKLGILAFNAARVENDLPKAIEYTKTRIDLYPDDPVAHNNLGWYYWNSGDLEEAVKEYKEVIRIDRHVVLSYGSLLWIYLEYLGDADSALVWSRKMVSDNPQNVWSYANLGSAWLCLDSLSKAEEAYAKAQVIDPDLIENLYNLAHIYRLLKKYDKSIIVLKHVLDINQNEISAYYNLGVNYECMENPEVARKYFTRVKRIITEERIKRTPDSAGAYNALAAVTARLGDMDSSMKVLQKAVKIDSTSHESFAEVFCLHGKVPEAINELEKAFKNGYRNLYWLKTSPDLQILQYDIRFRNLIEKYF